MLPPDARLHAILPAAGQGTRMGASLPKQYLTLDGRTLAEHTVTRLLGLARIDSVHVAVAADDPWWPALPVATHPRVRTVIGGDSRARSVLNALAAVDADGTRDWVLVHDMARPCVRLSDIERLLRECDEQGALLACPVADTIKQAVPGADRVQATLDRQVIWRALTPQLFPLGPLRQALAQGLAQGTALTDEASAMEAAGWRPRLVPGQADNIKVTWPADLALAGFYLQQQRQEGRP